MSEYCSVFAHIKQQTFVYGYLRIITENVAIVFPKDLYSLCFNFYNEVIRWTLIGNDFDNFFDCKRWSLSKTLGNDFSWTDDDKRINELIGPSFTIYNIPFTLSVRPRWNASILIEDCVYLSFSINNELFKDNIKHIMIYFILFFDELNYEYRHTTKLTKINDALWYWPCIKYDEIKSLQTHYKQLSFGCYAELLSIHYPLKPSKYLNFDTKMKSDCKYQWKLNTNELYRFKTAKFDYGLYSPNFNGDCFSIVSSPNGLSSMRESKGLILSKIKLLKLPCNIRSVNCLVRLEIIGINDNEKHEKYVCQDEIRKFSYDDTGSAQKDESINIALFRDVESIVFTATVKVHEVYDHAGHKVPSTQWNNYGICLV
eukprot:197275_1